MYKIIYILILLILLFKNLDAQNQVGSDINGETTFNQSGFSVSMSSDGIRLAIGAIENSGNGQNSGHVRIYEDNGNGWIQIGEDIDGENAEDASGYSISISSNGSRVAIGAVHNSENGLNSGHVRIYEENNGVWTQIGSDIDGEGPGDSFGFSVSLSSNGTKIAIGSLGSGNNGYVKVYEENNNNWTQIGGNIEGGSNDNSGFSVSISSDGTKVAVGGTRNGGGVDRGRVRVFEELGGSWSQIGSDINGEADGDISGFSISLSSNGTRVAIGAPGNDGSGGSSGHVRIYEENNEVWTQIGSDIDGESPGDQSGRAVDLSDDGTRVAIGAPENDGNGFRSGHVRVYDTTIPLPVTLQYFNSKLINQKVYLLWSTLNENSNSGFEVQRSSNTNDWISLSFINGNLNSITQNDYQYIDNDPMKGDNYYRLKQIDVNGNFTYTLITHLRLLSEFGTSDYVYPNPADNQLNLSLNEPCSIIKIMDVHGKVVLQKLCSEELKQQINIESLSRGIYIIQFGEHNLKSYFFEKI